MRVSGIFAGIGGLEEGLRRAGHETVQLCEIDPTARAVLQSHFPDVHVDEDVRKLLRLAKCDIVAAGFPCQDLSQVGKTRGINGKSSGLVTEVIRLISQAGHTPRWLVLENVPFMLSLKKGQAIRKLTRVLEEMNWRWAYRTVDSRAFGLPQRRRRVIFVASKSEDPRRVLFADDFPFWPHSLPDRASAYGFYWTEGNTGIGWAVDAVPTLKGGSSLAIPSPPGIWLPESETFGTPSITDAERLQGFRGDWTIAATKADPSGRQRWRLVGNAVSVPVAKWIGSRLSSPGDIACDAKPMRRDHSERWPRAAWGQRGERYEVFASEAPLTVETKSLITALREDLRPLSYKAANGFYTRLSNSSLKSQAAFLRQLRAYVSRAKSQ